MEFKEFLKSAASVKPSARQMNWFDTEFYAFVHFTVNTYTDLEWGLGDEPESIFNPYDLNCDEWVEAVKSAGMKGLVLTAKHHDGFCLWPSAYTEHSVKNSPWKDGKGDVVRECAEACKRGGIKFGVYLSPWDRNSKYYGTDAYNDYYCNQLTELLTNYGELFMVWFDGACGEGPNGKKQVYDFDRYIALIRKYQPNACIFNDHGPDVRWCGNEAGQARRAEWAVVPTELCYRCDVQTGPGPLAEGADLSFMYNSDQNIGELNNIMYSKGLGFAGSEIDMSIRPGWFYHEKEEPHSLDRLFRTYINSCGANTSFNLNVPPMPSGRFDPRDIQRLKELGELLENSFGESKKVPCTVKKIDTGSDTQCKYEIELPEETDVRFVELREDLAAAGQRIESFRIYGDDGCKYYDYTVGHRRLCWMKTKTKKLILHITSARDEVVLRDISVYKA
ncbi:MAG: alpha-L-fucosidase [Clostridia bacterium]|nr:alpha-fucosidase [Oscillospiraceae bacterium]MBO4932959.1 alpha-L-fucosidase [Clostridia bacterium]MBO5126154.1 alpha-L-fucosidase [Clostridia bacterium]